MTAVRPSERSFPDIVASRLADIAELCRRFDVRRLDLFGSAATGRFDPARSDLDFLVAFEEMPPGRYAKAYFGLREGLEALFQRRVDVLTEGSIENPYLRRQIESEKRPLYSQSVIPQSSSRRKPGSIPRQLQAFQALARPRQ
jgi:predicted nucleotidyltransferase